VNDDPTDDPTDPTDPTEDRPRADTPAGVEREVWRELASQKELVKATADTAKRTHSKIIELAGAMGVVKDETRRTAEFTGRLVDLAEARENREATKAERDAKAAEALAEREAKASAALAERRSRVYGKLVDWWVDNWRTILIALAILLGINVTPLLQAFGLMAPTAVIAPAEVIAPAAPADLPADPPAVEAPTDPAPTDP
jgi:hypothetical protein